MATTRLRMPRSEASAKLQERIDKAVGIAPAEAKSRANELAIAERNEKRWRDYNSLLLRTLFTTSEFADEYGRSVIDLHPVGDTYLDPDPDVIRERLVRSITNQRACLSSIIDRLPLIEEDSGSEAMIAREDEASGAPAENVVSKEEWITAAEAMTILKPAFGTHEARMTICKRAHRGIIRARTQHFIMNGKTWDNCDIPKEFWWAEGHQRLRQNWTAGDFETSTNDQVRMEAFGVSFLRAEIEKMLPTGAPAPPPPPSVPPGTDEPPVESNIPIQPQLEDGPQFQVASGKLDLVPGRETDQSFDHATQTALQRRLKRQVESLKAEAAKAANQHPSLRQTVDEYATLIDQPLADLDVVDLWAVGNALMVQARSFERQDQTRTLTEPLEPAHLALLLDVARLHAGFIVGFPKGIELMNRADRVQLTPDVIERISEPTSHILAGIAQARQTFTERARRLADIVNAALITGEWNAARIGHTAYAFVRNALIAIGSVLVRINSAGETLAGVAIIATASQVGVSVESVAGGVELLRSNFGDIFAFAASFPELRAWLECIIDHLDDESDDRGRSHHPGA
jgi:hypothetical protein